MKKLSRIFLSLCALFLLSGCMKYNVSMDISKDKSMNLQVIVAIDEESFKEIMQSMGSDDYDDESLSSLTDMSEGEEIFKNRGYEVRNYSEGNYNGIIADLKIKNIDDVSVEEDLEVVLSNILNEEFDDSKFFKVEKQSDKNIYTANFIYKADESSDDNTMHNVPGLELKYTVKLPYKVISDNADSKRNNELTWNISLDKETNIKYSFEVPNELEDDEAVSDNTDDDNAFIAFISNNAMIIGLVTLVVVIIIVVIIIIVSKNKKKNKGKKSNMTQPINNPELVSDNDLSIVEDVVTDSNSNESLDNKDIQAEINNETLVDNNSSNDTSGNEVEVVNNESIITNEKSEDLDTEAHNSETHDTESLNDENIHSDSVNNEIEDSTSDEEAFTKVESEVLNTQENDNGPKICETCGVEVEDGQKFCMNCGSKLD